MNNELLEEIHATVTKVTADDLRERGEFLHMTIGEVIDRLVLSISIDDPNLAAALICDYVGMTIKNQTDEQLDSTLFMVMGHFFKFIMDSGKYTTEDVIKLIKENQNTINEYISALKSKND